MSLKKLTKAVIVVAASSFVFGCAPTSKTAPVAKEVKGNTVDISTLAGSWEGKYISTVTQRSGVISLNLNKGTNKAAGQVLLTSNVEEKVRAHTPKGNTSVKSVTSAKVRPLPIEFVAIKDGKVSGSVTPYPDPAFGGATVFTTFKGTLTGNKMEGTFTSRIGQSGNSYNGSWWATRK